MQSNTPNVIYDLGSNNGDDLPYYLKKAAVVVAVEANPALCEIIKERFPLQIEEKRLFVENCAIAAEGGATDTTFYLHKSDHVLSQFPRPADNQMHEFSPITVPLATPKELILKYGAPLYIKVDLEHYDGVILRHLFSNGIRPPFISAETHNIDVFCLLVALGGYNAFKLVDGRTVSEKYAECEFKNLNGDLEIYSFPFHSAGPFGDDVHGHWMSSNDFFRKLALEGLGWKDIHATNIREVKRSYVRRREFLFHELRYAAKAIWAKLKII